MMANRKNRRAFSLLELTIATAMMAILALSLYTSMSVAFRARGTVERQMTAAREAAIVLDLIERDLQSVVPPSGVLSGPFIGFAMGVAGVEADQLEFHALGIDPDVGASPHADGIRRIQLHLRQDTQPTLLIRRVDRNLLAPVRETQPDEVIARGLRAFALRYYDGQGWVTDWDSSLRRNILPLAVEVSIELDHPMPDNEEIYYRAVRIIPLAPGRPSTATELIGGGL